LLLSPFTWLAYALLGAAAAYALPAVAREIVLGTLIALAGYLAWRILDLERRKRAPLDLRAIDTLGGWDFERWIVARLEAEGIATRNVRDSGDFGVDVIAEIAGRRVGIQSKRYEAAVSNEAIQEVLAGCDYHRCDLAAVVTQSRFTAAAVEQARRARYTVVLVSRVELHRMVTLLRDAAGDS